MKLSATRLRTYQTCPRQYRYRYVEGLPTTVSLALVFGRTIHAAICHLHRRALETAGPLDLADALDAFEGLWRHGLDEEQPTVKDPADVTGYEGWAGQILAGYVMANERVAPPVALEFGFDLPWEGHVLTGFIDRIDEGPEGLTIVDFKSGGRKPSPAVVRDDVQLTLYAFVASQLLAAPVERVVYYHLRDQTPIVTRRDADDYDRFEAGVLRPVTAAIEAGCYPPKRGWYCRFCDFRETCDAERPAGVFIPTAPAVVSVP